MAIAPGRTGRHTVPRYICIAVLAVALCCVGCSDRPHIVPVSGQVLIDGKPLGYGFVRFSSGEGRPALGRLDKEGRFRLTTYESGDGAIVGSHRIAILAHQITDTGIKWHAPSRYADYATSGLTQEISEPTDSLVINLTQDKEKKRR
jgi:hypothetical protein